MRLGTAAAAISAANLLSIGILGFTPSLPSQLHKLTHSVISQINEHGNVLRPITSPIHDVSPSLAFKRSSQLSMGFKHDPENSNMFDGYMALTKERDACGVGFIANPIQGGDYGTHKVLQQGLAALTCMEHRGACGGDGVSGDGAGIMTMIPWKIFEEYRTDEVPYPGVGMVFLPQDEGRRNSIKEVIEDVCRANELEFVAWREVPVDESVLGVLARASVPSMWQMVVRPSKRLKDDSDRLGFCRSLYLVRRRFEVERKKRGLWWDDEDNVVYVASLSSRTIVYKGMVQSCVLSEYYLDLKNPDYTTKFCIYHRRFSTNTVPKWPLAQPMRVLGHNGEINTLLGNMNWIRAREKSKGIPVSNEFDIDEDGMGLLGKSGYIRDLVDYENTDNIVQLCNTQDIPDVLEPLVDPGRSDSANLDGVFELMCRSRHRTACALMCLVPTAYEDEPSLANNPEYCN